MIRILSIIVFALFFYNAHSQDLKKKSTSDGDIKESYFVLKSDQNVKHGDYELKIFGKKVQKGQFRYGKKSGTWIYYETSGETEFSYDYDADSVIPNNANETILTYYSEGNQYFWYLISKNIHYPADARDAGIKGMIIISFTVDIDGKAKDFLVNAGCGNLSLNTEALRVVEIAATEHCWFQWVNVKEERQKTEFLFPVSFRL
ncbi:MAG: TonB family protein [Lentimicrobium sp.]